MNPLHARWLFANLMLGLFTHGCLGMPVSDSPIDAVNGFYATYDITSIDAIFTNTDLTFIVNLTTNPLAPSSAGNAGIRGFIDIDVDTNIGTGVGSNISTLSSPFGNSGLGIEYYIDLFSEANHTGFVDVKDPINVMNVTTAPIIYGNKMLSISVGLNQIGNDDGLVHYAVAVGDFANVTDQAMDASAIMMGNLPAGSRPAPVPLPASLVLFLSAASWLGVKRTKIGWVGRGLQCKGISRKRQVVGSWYVKKKRRQQNESDD